MAEFDVFLSHNSKDKLVVIELAERLKAQRLKVWLDVWELRPGHPWQEALEEIAKTTQAAAVLVGKDGIGPWQDREMRGCLSEFVERDAPVIPVLLPGCPEKPKLPFFLKQFTWVDLRDGVDDKRFEQLVWGITGKKPPQLDFSTSNYELDDDSIEENSFRSKPTIEKIAILLTTAIMIFLFFKNLPEISSTQPAPVVAQPNPQEKPAASFPSSAQKPLLSSPDKGMSEKPQPAQKEVDVHKPSPDSGGYWPVPGLPRFDDPVVMDMSFWGQVQDSDDPEDFLAYLDKYPNGRYAALARNAIRRLREEASHEGKPIVIDPNRDRAQ